MELREGMVLDLYRVCSRARVLTLTAIATGHMLPGVQERLDKIARLAAEALAIIG